MDTREAEVVRKAGRSDHLRFRYIETEIRPPSRLLLLLSIYPLATNLSDVFLAKIPTRCLVLPRKSARHSMYFWENFLR